MLRCPANPSGSPRVGGGPRERYRTYRRNLATSVVVVALLTPARHRVALGAEQRGELHRGQRRRRRRGAAGVDPGAGRRRARAGGRHRLVDRVPEGRGQLRLRAAATAPATTTSSPTARRARRSTPCGAARAGSCPTSSCCCRPGSPSGRSPSACGKLEGKSAERFLAAATSGAVRSRYQPAEVNSLEGLTWPDTYFIGANETEEQILQKIVDSVRHQGRRRSPSAPPVRPTAGRRRTRRSSARR